MDRSNRRRLAGVMVAGAVMTTVLVAAGVAGAFAPGDGARGVPNNSVDSASIINNTVKSVDIKNGTLLEKDLDGTLQDSIWTPFYAGLMGGDKVTVLDDPVIRIEVECATGVSIPHGDSSDPTTVLRVQYTSTVSGWVTNLDPSTSEEDGIGTEGVHGTGNFVGPWWDGTYSGRPGPFGYADKHVVAVASDGTVFVVDFDAVMFDVNGYDCLVSGRSNR